MKIFSHLKVTASGLNQNLLLQKIQKSGVNISCYKRVNHSCSTFLISEKNFNKIKKQGLLERFDIQTSPSVSLAYFFWRVPVRIGLLSGLLAVTIFCILFSQYMFNISITGCTAEQRQQIQQVLNERNIKGGTGWKNINLKELEAQIFATIPTSSNVVARRNGIKLEISVGQAALQRKTKGDIVAQESGTIDSIEVSSGVALKKKGDLVLKGEVIVKADASGYCSAKVNFRVYRQSSVAVKNYQTEWVRSGDVLSTSKYYAFYQKQLPPQMEVPFARYQVEVKREECFLYLFLPYTRVTTMYYGLVEKQVDEKVAKERATEDAYKLASNGISQNQIVHTRYEYHTQNDLNFVDCFIEAVILLG